MLPNRLAWPGKVREYPPELDSQSIHEDRVMIEPGHFRDYLLMCALIAALRPLPGIAQQDSDASNSADGGKTWEVNWIATDTR
jgi:hypothetical protein